MCRPFQKFNQSFIMSSMLPHRQFAFSIELAQTLGLEEAIMLQYLSDESSKVKPQSVGQTQWFVLHQPHINQMLSFWSAQDIQRITENLRQQGILLIGSAPYQESKEIRYGFNKSSSIANNTQPYQTLQQTIPSAGKTTLARNWKPDTTALRLLTQQGVPEHFAHEQVAEFSYYWHERGEPHHSWGSRFAAQVMRKWREFESTQQHQKNQTSQRFKPYDQGAYQASSEGAITKTANETVAMHKGWQPSLDALEFLGLQVGINRNFVDDAVAEFVMFWSEKGEVSNTWNARFIQHVKRQWAVFQNNLKHDRTPCLMTSGWQPDEDAYDVLRLAEIDLDFAKSLIPGFILYWRDRSELRPSWNTVFIQFVKTEWQRKLSGKSDLAATNTRGRTLEEDIFDRSWAD